jgi:hypothetical protein
MRAMQNFAKIWVVVSLLWGAYAIYVLFNWGSFLSALGIPPNSYSLLDISQMAGIIFAPPAILWLVMWSIKKGIAGYIARK